MAEGIPLVELNFPGEIRIGDNNVITVGDANVTELLRDALGHSPRLHGRLLVRFVADPITLTVASSTFGGRYQEPAELGAPNAVK